MKKGKIEKEISIPIVHFHSSPEDHNSFVYFQKKFNEVFEEENETKFQFHLHFSTYYLS